MALAGGPALERVTIPGWVCCAACQNTIRPPNRSRHTSGSRTGADPGLLSRQKTVAEARQLRIARPDARRLGWVRTILIGVPSFPVPFQPGDVLLSFFLQLPSVDAPCRPHRRNIRARRRSKSPAEVPASQKPAMLPNRRVTMHGATPSVALDATMSFSGVAYISSPLASWRRHRCSPGAPRHSSFS